MLDCWVLDIVCLGMPIYIYKEEKKIVRGTKAKVKGEGEGRWGGGARGVQLARQKYARPDANKGERGVEFES